MPTGIYISGIPKRYNKREPDIDISDEFYELNPDALERDLEEIDIPLLKMCKHFPWHNAEYSVWLDREFGDGRSGYTYQDPSTIREDLESIMEQIPDITQWINIRGKNHIRQVGICSTVTVATEVKKIIAESSRLEPMMDKEPKFWNKTDVVDSATEISGGK